MPLPENPQPIDQLRARYRQGLSRIYDHTDPRTFTAAGRPGNQQAQVFDAQDGIRLIVSRERNASGILGVHCSASILETPAGVELAERLKRAGNILREWKGLALAKWAELDPDRARRAVFIGWSEKGCPHWFAVDAN